MAEDSDKNDPPPPSLSKPDPGPPPPDLSSPTPAPQGAPPVVQEKPTEVEEADDALSHGAIAPLNTRLLAGLIDGLVAVGIGIAASIVLPDLLDRLVWVLQAAYWVTRDSLPFLKGQSIGKTAMKLKAVKAGGGSLVNDWQTAIIRNVLLIVPFFGIIEVIVLLTRDNKPERGMRLGDDWAKTKVVVHRPEEDQPDEEAA
ncbi:MAG: RDD family protein [Verrucomicrobiota bacterium]